MQRLRHTEIPSETETDIKRDKEIHTEIYRDRHRDTQTHRET